MNIDTLKSHIKHGDVQELNLMSMEGGSYVLHALIDGASVPVEDAHGATLHVASVDEARKVLAGVDDVRLYLVQGNAHDEMIGHAEDGNAAPREEIPLRSSL